MIYRGVFEKKGYIRLIGHLDLMKVFQRAISRAGFNLDYSEGFNPSPKLSLANPLSLGLESSYEFIEFETTEDYSPEKIKNRVNKVLPRGILIKELNYRNPNSQLSKLVYYISYEISFPPDYKYDEVRILVDKLIEKDSYPIYIKKKVKKKKTLDIPVEVRKIIDQIDLVQCGDHVKLEYLIKAKNGANLRADYLIQALSEIGGLEMDYSQLIIKRTGQYGYHKKLITSKS